MKLVYKRKITIKSNISFAENLRINLKATSKKKLKKIFFGEMPHYSIISLKKTPLS